jgi:hypothetical protein
VSVNAERLKLGIAALESGKHLKGASYLHQVDEEGVHRKCCLGVLTLEAIANGLDIRREMLPATHDYPAREIYAGMNADDDEEMCPEVMDWYGFTQSDPELITAAGNYRLASAWNDSGPLPDDDAPPEEDFTEIAAGFRRTFLEGK